MQPDLHAIRLIHHGHSFFGRVQGGSCGADHGETGSFDRLAVATCDVKCSDQER